MTDRLIDPTFCKLRSYGTSERRGSVAGAGDARCRPETAMVKWTDNSLLCPSDGFGGVHFEHPVANNYRPWVYGAGATTDPCATRSKLLGRVVASFAVSSTRFVGESINLDAWRAAATIMNAEVSAPLNELNGSNKEPK